jgi:hypothetical protein
MKVDPMLCASRHRTTHSNSNRIEFLNTTRWTVEWRDGSGAQNAKGVLEASKEALDQFVEGISEHHGLRRCHKNIGKVETLCVTVPFQRKGERFDF